MKRLNLMSVSLRKNVVSGSKIYMVCKVMEKKNLQSWGLPIEVKT